MIILARCALIAIMSAGATNLVAQKDSVFQEIPRPALLELLRHVTEAGPSSGRQRAFGLMTRRFPDRAAAAEAARAAGFAVYDSYEQILGCSNQTPPTCSFAVGDRVSAVNDVRASGDIIVVNVTVSTFLRRRNGVARLSPTIREITLRRSGGRWQVEDDRVLMRS